MNFCIITFCVTYVHIVTSCYLYILGLRNLCDSLNWSSYCFLGLCFSYMYLFLLFRLIQCENEVGKLLFITEIPELILEDPSETKENLILQETSVIESLVADGSPGLKSVLSTGRNLSNNCDTGEKPVVTFKENIKPREVNRDQGRTFPPKEVRRDCSNGITVTKNDGKKDNNKRKTETKKCTLEKLQETGKQNVAVQVSCI